MHFKRLCTAGLALVLSAATLTGPVYAADIMVYDRNRDGIIDVQDYALYNKNAGEGTYPIFLGVSEARSVPGDIITLEVSIACPDGISAASFDLVYPELLLPVMTIDDVSGAFAGLMPVASVTTQQNKISYVTQRTKNVVPEGKAFTVSFRVSEKAQPGQTFTVGFENVQFTGADGQVLDNYIGVNAIYVDEQKATVPAVTTTTAETGTTTTTTAAVTEPVVTTLPETTTAVTTTTAATTTTTEVTTVTTETTEPLFTTTTAQAYLAHGIDISAWQGKVDFAKVAADPQVDFAILRAGYGRYIKQKDPCFEEYYNGCKANHIPVGAYWYSYAMNAEEARMEAEVCLEAIAGKSFEYPIAFDFEEPKQLALPTEEIDAIITAFCEVLEDHGYFAQLYCSSFYLNRCVGPQVKKDYDVWCAHTGVSRPTYTGNYGMWQYSWTGKIDGINGDVDMDYSYRDYMGIITNRHLNGF